MAEQVVELAPGESKLVSFEAIPHEAKTYQVTVDGLAGNFVAKLPPAPVAETLRPNAAGDVTDLPGQYPSGGSHWDKVDEAEADDDTTTVYNNVQANRYDLYGLPASSGEGTINKITLYFRTMMEKEGAFAKAVIKSDTTTTYGALKYHAVADLWYDFSQEWALNPADSEAWEWADIDALQIGVNIYTSAGYKAYITQVYVEVDYTP